jgi:hypothetical protein
MELFIPSNITRKLPNSLNSPMFKTCAMILSGQAQASSGVFHQIDFSAK